MSKGNPHPKPPPPPIGKRNAAKSEVNLVAYNVRIDPATVWKIKQLQTLLTLKSQGEVITMAINMLMEKSD